MKNLILILIVQIFLICNVQKVHAIGVESKLKQTDKGKFAITLLLKLPEKQFVEKLLSMDGMLSTNLINNLFFEQNANPNLKISDKVKQLIKVMHSLNKEDFESKKVISLEEIKNILNMPNNFLKIILKFNKKRNLNLLKEIMDNKESCKTEELNCFFKRISTSPIIIEELLMMDEFSDEIKYIDYLVELEGNAQEGEESYKRCLRTIMSILRPAKRFSIMEKLAAKIENKNSKKAFIYFILIGVECNLKMIEKVSDNKEVSERFNNTTKLIDYIKKNNINNINIEEAKKYCKEPLFLNCFVLGLKRTILGYLLANLVDEKNGKFLYRMQIFELIKYIINNNDNYFKEKPLFAQEILHKMCFSMGQEELVKRLIKHGITLQKYNDVCGRSCMFYFVENGLKEQAKNSILGGININKKDVYGSTTLRYEVFKTLFVSEKGKQDQDQDQDKDQIIEDSILMSEMLLEYGAELKDIISYTKNFLEKIIQIGLSTDMDRSKEISNEIQTKIKMFETMSFPDKYTYDRKKFKERNETSILLMNRCYDLFTTWSTCKERLDKVLNFLEKEIQIKKQAENILKMQVFFTAINKGDKKSFINEIKKLRENHKLEKQTIFFEQKLSQAVYEQIESYFIEQWDLFEILKQFCRKNRFETEYTFNLQTGLKNILRAIDKNEIKKAETIASVMIKAWKIAA